MSRPAHIAPLDEALDEHLARLIEAEVHQRHVHTKHAEAMREVEAAAKARQDAYYAARSCENAIRQLGYAVLEGKGKAGVVGKDKSRLDGHGGNFREPITTDQEATQ